ncbi:MAG: GNAT family N-acetyltransferase [Melioribacteraceae bacterium]|nr:GNAT family N-acetyltransferase [Melioribacteraceae bacterium]
MSYFIRNYIEEDFDKLLYICLKTGDSGNDATTIYKDPNLLGSFYTAPYLLIHPELALILTYNNEPIGYIIGTDNSQKFFELTEEKYFPELRKKYPLPNENDNSADARIIRLIHQGHKPKVEFQNYPAHLHIDILPEGQGKGFGRKLIDSFINKLIELNVNALHLEVGKRNTNAIAFYEKYGFHKIAEFDYSIGYGIFLNK